MLDDVARRSSRYKNHRFLTREEEAALIQAWKTGDDSAGTQLAEAFQPLIKSQTAVWSKKYSFVDPDAISSAVNMGFAKTLEKFDLDRGVRLSLYAEIWIKAMVQQEAREASVVRAAARTDQARAVFADVTKIIRGPEDLRLHEIYDRVAKTHEMDAARVRKIHETAVHIVSGDKTTTSWHGDERSSLFDRIEDSAPQTEEVVENNTMIDAMRKAMTVLPPREAYVISARFGLFKGNEGEVQTLEEIAEKIHLSKERVRQIEVRAIQMLRHEFQDIGFDMKDLMIPSGKNCYVPPRKFRKDVPETYQALKINPCTPS